jgi:galactokinase
MSDVAPQVFRAPGRVNLIGEHTDYSGGLVLPAAIDRAVTLEGRPGGDRIRLASHAFGDPVDVAADGAGSPQGWGRYVAAVAAELAEVGRDPVGFRGALTSDLPAGAGLSSSAALEVVVGLALCEAAGFDLAPLDLAAVCQRAERRAVGVPVGIMDQAASLLGRGDHAVLLDCGALEYRLVPLPTDLGLLVVDSNVSRTLEGSSYADRRRELEAGLAALDGRDLKDLAAEDLPRLLDGVDEIPARRVRHVVTENARVRSVEAALTRPHGADRGALGELFLAGHVSLRDDFEVSTPELDLLVDLAYEAGAVAARLTGGGFGGAIVALVDRDRLDEIGEMVAQRYAASASGRRAGVHRCVAAAGAGRTA